MQRIHRMRARLQAVLFSMAGTLVPGGVPFGLIDHGRDASHNQT